MDTLSRPDLKIASTATAKLLSHTEASFNADDHTLSCVTPVEDNLDPLILIMPESKIGPWGNLPRHFMADEGCRIDFTWMDVFQEIVFIAEVLGSGGPALAIKSSGDEVLGDSDP